MTVTEEQIAAAELRVVLDEKLGRETPEIVRRIAGSQPSRDSETATDHQET